MSLVRMDELLVAARYKKYAIPAFEIWDSTNIYSIATAAAKCNAPVIFQATVDEYTLMGGPEVTRHIVEKYVEKTGITAALHLDHGASLEQVEECIAAGFTSVMLDASSLPFEENIKLSAMAAQIAHRHNVSIEAELGHVGGNDEGGIQDNGKNHLTNPGEACTFVEETGIDCLAVAIGTVHGEYKGEPHIDLERLNQIANIIDQPLVLHGGSGTPRDVLQQAIQMGIAKINICTDIHKAWLNGLKQAYESLTHSLAGRFYRPGSEQLQAKVTEIIKQFQLI